MDKQLKYFWTDTMREQFLRIANARLRRTYKYEPQRRAWCAKMWSKWCERKKHDLSIN